MKTRKLIQLISLMLFPITMYYFSPYLIIMGLSEKIITGSFIVFALLMVTSIFSGRLFCSTICPAGAMQDIMINRQFSPLKRNFYRYFKWGVFTIWMAVMILLVSQVGLPEEVDPLYQTAKGISIHQPMGYIIYYAVIGLFLILALIFGNRGGCHTVCWMSPFMIVGSKLGRLLKLPYYGLTCSDNCIQCSKCDKVCPMTLKVSGMVEKKNMFHVDCISCNACVEACPKHTLKIKWRKS